MKLILVWTIMAFTQATPQPDRFGHTPKEYKASLQIQPVEQRKAFDNGKDLLAFMEDMRRNCKDCEVVDILMDVPEKPYRPDSRQLQLLFDSWKNRNPNTMEHNAPYDGVILGPN